MITRALILALVLVTAAHAADPRLLAAIRQAEGVKHPAKAGPAGELGYHAMTFAAWVRQTRAPFARAGTDHVLEAEVAAKHLDWLERELVRAGEVPTPYRLALAWNAGLEGSRRGAPAIAYDYARRVTNLYAVEAAKR